MYITPYSNITMKEASKIPSNHIATILLKTLKLQSLSGTIIAAAADVYVIQSSIWADVINKKVSLHKLDNVISAS